MPITARNIVRHELIGLRVRVAKSTDPTQQGIAGKVIDETYKTLKIESRVKTASGIKIKEKIIPKNSSIFIFTLPNKTKVRVVGSLLVGRPEDRIKKKFPRW